MTWGKVRTVWISVNKRRQIGYVLVREVKEGTGAMQMPGHKRQAPGEPGARWTTVSPLVYRGQKVFVDCLFHGVFRESADSHLRLSCNRDEEKRRNAPDTECSGQLLLFVCIDLIEVYFAFVLIRELIDHGAYHTAWSTPRRPKIDNTRKLSFKLPLFVHFVVEHLLEEGLFC